MLEQGGLARTGSPRLNFGHLYMWNTHIQLEHAARIVCFRWFNGNAIVTMFLAIRILINPAVFQLLSCHQAMPHTGRVVEIEGVLILHHPIADTDDLVPVIQFVRAFSPGSAAVLRPNGPRLYRHDHGAFGPQTFSEPIQ